MLIPISLNRCLPQGYNNSFTSEGQTAIYQRSAASQHENINYVFHESSEFVGNIDESRKIDKIILVCKVVTTTSPKHYNFINRTGIAIHR